MSEQSERRRSKKIREWRRANESIVPRVDKMYFGSKRWDDQCGSKIAHFSYGAAMRQIEEISRKPLIHNENGRKLTIYTCPWCEWLHVGHEAKIARGETIYIHWC